MRKIAAALAAASALFSVPAFATSVNTTPDSHTTSGVNIVSSSSISNVSVTDTVTVCGNSGVVTLSGNGTIAVAAGNTAVNGP